MKCSTPYSYVTACISGMLVAVAIVLLDQWSKKFIVSYGQFVDFPIEVLPFFNIVLVYNTGISFGMFAHKAIWLPYFLTFGTSVVVLVLFVWFLRTRDKWTHLALPFIIGGAIGNIIDRLTCGAVTDFLDFHIGPYHWPAFNIADSSIFIGVVILVLISIVGRDESGPSCAMDPRD